MSARLETPPKVLSIPESDLRVVLNVETTRPETISQGDIVELRASVERNVGTYDGIHAGHKRAKWEARLRGEVVNVASIRTGYGVAGNTDEWRVTLKVDELLGDGIKVR